MATKRIEYIDAMRGLTMILVVYSHICNYCLGDRMMALNDVMFIFRLPCFFFISGWLFFRHSYPDVPGLIRHKFMVQIVPTFIFLLLLAGPMEFFDKLGAVKGGYWFTFALFEFFCLYILSNWLFRKAKRSELLMFLFALLISVAAFYYDIFYNRLVQSGILNMSLKNLLGFLSFMTWRYYLFFFIGTMVRRHFDTFLRWTSKAWVIIILALIFLSLITYHSSLITEYIVFSIGGISGMILVFTFFRVFARYFTKERWLGRSLQYIGTRTLDIYLLHYFFLPRFLAYSLGVWLIHQHSLLLEMLIALALALAVVALSLLTSRLICQNPHLGHYLFGKKLPTDKS